MAENYVSSDYTRTYTSFSGCDIVCTVGNVVVGQLQAVSYSVSREKAPVYTFGNANPRGFARGKRGVAGTMVFTNFDRDALLYALQEYAATAATFQRIGGDLNITPLTIDEWDKKMTDEIGIAGDNLASHNPEAVTEKIAKVTLPYYLDEVPPFDITISMANEYGQEAYMVIYGCEILNEGGGWSVDAITSEKACTFVGIGVKALTPLQD